MKTHKSSKLFVCFGYKVTLMYTIMFVICQNICTWISLLQITKYKLCLFSFYYFTNYKKYRTHFKRKISGNQLPKLHLRQLTKMTTQIVTNKISFFPCSCTSFFLTDTICISISC